MAKSSPKLKSFRSVIEAWSPAGSTTRRAAIVAMASDTGADPAAVEKWWQRDKIPDEWWSALVGTDLARRAGVTSDLLAGLAAAQRLGACA